MNNKVLKKIKYTKKMIKKNEIDENKNSNIGNSQNLFKCKLYYLIFTNLNQHNNK